LNGRCGGASAPIANASENFDLRARWQKWPWIHISSSSGLPLVALGNCGNGRLSGERRWSVAAYGMRNDYG